MIHNTAIKARQMKAARALLDWSQDDLARQTGLSVATIRKLELGYISPRGKTISSIRQAFEDNGLEFLEPDGVRNKPEEITIYQGLDEAKQFYDDVYNTMNNKDGDVVIVSRIPNIIPTLFGADYWDNHIKRMETIKHRVPVRCIITESYDYLPSPSYCEYRLMSKSYVHSVPFYVYDNKYGIVTHKADPTPKIIVLQSQVIAEAFRQQFYSMWDKATPLNALQASSTPPSRKNARR